MYNLLMIKSRYLLNNLLEDIEDKMVFIGGPRQVGKTTFTKDIIGKNFKSDYYNWDNIRNRLTALKLEWNSEAELIILDEFHKYKKWKTWIKGEYDVNKDKFKFILTGSARLNIFRKGGDSLQGRYYYYTLFPFTLSEIENIKNEINPSLELNFKNINSNIINDLLRYGGFPEPLFKSNAKFHRRWLMNKTDRLINEDIRDLTLLRDIGNLTLLTELLKSKPGSILSINSLSNDLQLNFRTISNWLDVFENLYYCFRISAFNKKMIKSVKKEKKLYLWDWSMVDDMGARLENLVALHLLKFVYYLREAEGHNVNLHYLRDITGREVDFLISYDNQPWLSVEVKNKDKNVSKNILYFKEKLNIPYNYQVVNIDNTDFIKSGIRVISISKFLTALI